MGSEILRPENDDALPTSTPEVEFALVLSRMIDSVRNDPEHLRQTVYELARHKLQEQFASDEFGDAKQLSKALETAIHGVEAFSRKHNGTIAALPKPEPAREEGRWFGRARNQHAGLNGGPEQPVLEALEGNVSHAPKSTAQRKFSRFTAPWRFAAVLVIAMGFVFALGQKTAVIDALRSKTTAEVSPSTVSAKQPAVASVKAESTADTQPTPPSPLVPTSYGIYAVSQGKLYELELLPGRAPDIRVAISPAIITPSRAILPDGHVNFVVYRRDSATSSADRADIRIIAKIEREMSFDKAGKPVTSKADDRWVIRNISIPLRTAPRKDDPEMYQVQSEDPDFALTPGRYALVLKGQAYDFTVAGHITDTRHCLEQLAATNGQFYSECPKP